MYCITCLVTRLFSGSSSGVISICWSIGRISECSWLFMIVTMLVVFLFTMIMTFLLIVYSFYKKVLLICWYSSLVMRNHGFKLNEVELPRDVDAVTAFWVILSSGGTSVLCVGPWTFCAACTWCCNWNICMLFSRCTVVCVNGEDSELCAICLLVVHSLRMI